MHVLVTGGTGVIGNGAIPALLAAGHTIRLLSRHADREVESFPDGVESFAADIATRRDLDAALVGVDCILHIAGIVEEQPPETTYEAVNVGGTRNLIAAAKDAGQPYFVFISSLGADRGQSEYHQSKLRAEEIVRSYHGRWVVLRPGNVYGPGDETVSMLLKMVRTLPAIPMVARGDQPFAPIWYSDLGRLIEQVVGDPELTGRTFEVAGPDVTSTDDLIKRLGELTGRNVPRMTVPVWVTEVGVQAMEAFGGLGKRLLERAGVGAPLTSAKLDMLLEENVVPPGGHNALMDFVPEPTSLDDGLDMLADLLPEQLPGEGVGAIQRSRYYADIEGSPYRAAQLLDLVCEHIQSVMPIEFAAEPGVPRRADQPGKTLTAAIAGRGNIQVKLEEKTETRATFVTLEGHPLAGVMQLQAEDLGGGLRFNVHIASQASNVFDWVAMRVIGMSMQTINWRNVVRRVVKLSGGKSPQGVQHESQPMSENEAHDIRRFAERIVQTRKREERTAQVAGVGDVPQRAS